MKILITGSEGLIGSHLFKVLSLTHEVYGFDLKNQQNDPRFTRLRPDLIIHTAAHCVIKDTIEDPLLSKANVNVTYDVLELARKTGSKILMFSSGRVNHDVFNPYTASKRFNEVLTQAYHDCYGVDFITVRPETVWGLSKNNERVIIRWIQAALQGKPLEIYGPRSKELSPIYIEEFTSIVSYLVEHFDEFKGRIFNVSGEIRLAEDIAKVIIEKTKSKSKIKFRDAQKTQPQTCSGSDFTSTVPFETSLTQFLLMTCKK